MMRVHQNILTMGLNENSRVGEPIRSAVRGSARSIVFRGWTLAMVPVMVRAVVQAVSVSDTSGVWSVSPRTRPRLCQALR